MSPRQAAVVEPVEDDEEVLAERHRAAVVDEARRTYTGPGVYDWPGEAYHADPVPGGSARSTVLRQILADGGPALVEHEASHPRHSDAFDFGGAAHRLVLGLGDEIVEVHEKSWQTNAAKAARAEARARGARPLLSKELVKARSLARAVLAHPVAGPVFSDAVGVHERTVVWGDDETGETCRAMLDVFPRTDTGGVPVAGDLKTTETVDKRKLARKIVEYGYHQQGAFILDGLASIGLTEVDYLLVFVTKEPPHLIRVVRMPPALLELGRERNRRALDRWSWCRTTGVWPALPAVIDEIDAPSWAYYREDDEDQ